MPTPAPQNEALKNVLLAALPATEFGKISPALKEIRLKSGDVLWEADDNARHLYFPTTALIALLYETTDGTSVSIAAIGREGVAGTNVILADVRTPYRAVVQQSGVAFRIKADRVKDEFAECGDFQHLLMSYTQALLTQIAQNAICNRLHDVEQQICRWILVNYDHRNTNILSMTNDQIAAVLGVRRETVSIAAAQLQKRLLIKKTRGKIEAVKIDSIHDAVCECYGVVKNEHTRILTSYAAKVGS